MDNDVDHARLEPRTNMFVMASISATTASGPVKIRNLSPQGALIECDALPATGESFELKRGRLFAAGQVVWRQGNKAGLRFDRLIDVVDWLPSAHSAQQSVDCANQQLTSGAVGQSTVGIEPTARQRLIDNDQLRRVARALDLLADDLADDAALVMLHGQKLQCLDIASQMLRKLAAATA